MSKKQAIASSSEAQAAEIQSFEKAVEMLCHLRDEGRIILFLSARYSVRFVGEAEFFQDRLKAALEAAQLDGRRAAALISDIRALMQICLYARSQPHAVSMYESSRSFSSTASKKTDPQEKVSQNEAAKRKVSIVFERLITAALQDRAKRLLTAMGPILQDLDVEVISERKSHADETDVRVPFIRIRLRYTDRLGGLPAFLPVGFFPGENSSTESFDIECDEHDINLMLRRLESAKDTLLKAMGNANQTPT